MLITIVCMLSTYICIEPEELCVCILYLYTHIHLCRTSREQALKERVLQYSKTLQEQRKQARLISSPSSDLLQAEKNLAEVRLHYIRR